MKEVLEEGRYLPQPPELSREQNPALYEAISKMAESASDEPFRLPDFRSRSEA